MVTHDPIAASHADRVIFLADGRIVADKPRQSAEEISAYMLASELGTDPRPSPGNHVPAETSRGAGGLDATVVSRRAAGAASGAGAGTAADLTRADAEAGRVAAGEVRA